MKNGNSERIEPVKITEPMTMYYDEGKFVRIIAELSGVAEEKIRVDLENQSTLITILAFSSTIQYKKVINIPCEVRFSKKRFSEGILELILEKKSFNPL